MDNSISPPKRQQLRNKIRISKKAIQAFLKQYKYEQEVTHQKNMKKLCTCLENIMAVQSLQDFQRFVSHKQQLPIQINFMALKYEKIVEMFEDWLATKQQNASYLDRNLTHKHRNIIFKRIFIQQKDTIRQFFQTLSDKKKLKGFDLFQLLTELLGPYFLYQFNSDTETFFEKTNSFQKFTTIVQSFIKNGIRIYNKDRNDVNDQMYIRIHQLEALIQFWELVNPELTIQEYQKKNLNQAAVQTTQINLLSTQTQTQKQVSRGYVNVLNRTLHQINMLIQTQNDPQLLQSLDKIIEVIRNQKMFAVNYYAQLNQKKFQLTSKYMMGSDFSETQKIFYHESPHKQRTPPKILKSNNFLLSSLSQKQEDQTKTIYKYLCSKDNLNSLTINILQQFFCELGLAQPKQNHLIKNLINYGYVQDRNDITLKQFKAILRQIMSQNKIFNLNTLKIYISTNIEGASLKKTAYFKNPDHGHKKNQILSQSIVGRDRSYREESRTTYPMDSDGSNI